MPHDRNNTVAIYAIIDSDLVADSTARAVVLAQRLAGDGPPDLDQIQEAAHGCGARVEPVAAAYGWLRDADGEGWGRADEPDDDNAPPPLRIDDDQVLACLTVFVLGTHRPVIAGTRLHEGWAARQRSSSIRRDVGHNAAP